MIDVVLYIKNIYKIFNKFILFIINIFNKFILFRINIFINLIYLEILYSYKNYTVRKIILLRI